MTTKSFVAVSNSASGSNFSSLIDGGSPNNLTTMGGWIYGTNASPNYQIFKRNTNGTTGSFTSTSQLDASSGPSNVTNADSFRSQNKIQGIFSAGNWVATFKFGTTSGGAGGPTAAIRARFWASVNANGSSPRELTASTQTGTTAGPFNTVNTAYSSVVTWTPGTTITLDNEYLFIQIETSVVTAGSASSRNGFLGDGSNSIYTSITTPNYNPALAGTTKSITLNGQNATLQNGTGHPLAEASGSFSVSGSNASFIYGKVSQESSGSFSLDGHYSEPKLGIYMEGIVFNSSINPHNAGLHYGQFADLQSGSFSIAGQDAGFILTSNYNLIEENAVFDIDAGVGDLEPSFHLVLEENYGTFLISGSNADGRLGYLASSQSGQFNFSPNDGNLRLHVNYVMQSATANYTISGTNSSIMLKRNYPVSETSASYTITGHNINLKRGVKLVPASGNYVESPSNSNLVYHKTLNGALATFSYVGHNSTIKLGIKISEAQANFSINGQSILLKKSIYTSLTNGDYQLSGNQLSTKLGQTNILSTGSFVESPNDGALKLGTKQPSQTGEYILVGNSLETASGTVLGNSAPADIQIYPGEAIPTLEIFSKNETVEYTLIGNDLEFNNRYTASVDAATYNMNSHNSVPKLGLKISSQSGEYAFNDQNAEQFVDRFLDFANGEYNSQFSGSELIYGLTLDGRTGSFHASWQEIPIQIVIGHTGASGVYTINTHDSLLIYDHNIIGEESTYNIDCNDAGMRKPNIYTGTAILDWTHDSLNKSRTNNL